MQNLLKYVGFTAKYVVSGIAAASLLTNDSPMPLYYIVGALATASTGKIMKRIVRQPRPIKSPKQGFGMPSSHTNAIAYFSYVVLFTAPHYLPPNPLYQNFLALLVGSYGISACYWRIVSHLHSPAQIVVGGLLGIVAGYVATANEDTVAAYFDSHPVSRPVLLAIKSAVLLAIIPVVFKPELRWIKQRWFPTKSSPK